MEKYSEEIPNWVVSTDERFYAFLAGVYDAEGHLGIYISRIRSGGLSTQLSVVNTNRKLINCLSYQLRSRGFPVRIKSQKSTDSTWYALVLEQRMYVQRLLKMMAFRHPKKKAVARLILRLPEALNARGRADAVAEYKGISESMSRDDRREGEVSLLALQISV